MPAQPEEGFAFSVRPGGLKDRAYVANSWLRGIQRSTYWAIRIPSFVFWPNQAPIIERILEKEQLAIAHPVGDEDTILGWLVFDNNRAYRTSNRERDVLHWVYVRTAWRGIGIARKLVEAAGLSLAHTAFPLWSYDCNTLVKKFPAEFNPYLHFER